jgi:hypothetical protein
MKGEAGHKSASTVDSFKILPNLHWVTKTGVGKLRGFDVENNFGSGHLLLPDISANSFGGVGALWDGPWSHQQCSKGLFQ